MTREDVRAAISDRHALIATLYGEAAGEPIEGIIAVACVIRNRASVSPARWWGSGYKAVCLKPGQFSCWWETNENTARVYQLAEALLTKQPIGMETLIAELAWVAAGVIEEQLRDNTRTADHYLTSELYHRAPPAWVKGSMPVAIRGNHSFFRLEI